MGFPSVERRSFKDRFYKNYPLRQQNIRYKRLSTYAIGYQSQWSGTQRGRINVRGSVQAGLILKKGCIRRNR